MTTVQEDIDVVWMRQALQLAAAAAAANEVPVGAVIVRDGQVLGKGANSPIGSCDPTAHAEIVALRDAARQESNYRLPGATLYVTIEPCTMCVGALVHARVSRVVFGAREPKAGMVASQASLFEHAAMNTTIRVTEGVLADECSALMSAFFASRRARKKALKQAANANDDKTSP